MRQQSEISNVKHVFGVASHLTFHVANRIIEQDGINEDDCYFLLLRNYTIPAEFKDKYKHRLSTSYNVDVSHGRIFAGIHLAQTRRNIRQFDELIDHFTGGNKYIWYTSICYSDICSMMVTRKQCCGYYVMEDGLVSYERNNPQTFVGWRYGVYRLILKPLYPRTFLLKNHFITTDNEKFMGCLASSAKCFPLHQQYLRVIGPIFKPQEYNIKPNAILSIDPLFIKGVEMAKVEEVFQRLATFVLAKKYACIAYKFHPRFMAESNKHYRDAYCDLLNRLFPQIKELPQDVVLEKILLWSKADFYSCDSSVALYVNEAGVKCYSMMPLLRNTPAYVHSDVIQSVSIPIDK